MARPSMLDEIAWDIADRLRTGMKTRDIAAAFNITQSSILKLAKRLEIQMHGADRETTVPIWQPGQEHCACGRSVAGKCVACAAWAWRKRYGLAE